MESGIASSNNAKSQFLNSQRVSCDHNALCRERTERKIMNYPTLFLKFTLVVISNKEVKSNKFQIAHVIPALHEKVTT